MPTARSFGCPAILITTFGSKAMSQALIWHNLHIKASEANFLLHTQIHEQPAAAANAAKVAAAAPPTNAADVGHGSSPSCWPFTAASDLVVMLMRLLLRVHWPSCCLLAPLFVVSFFVFCLPHYVFAAPRVDATAAAETSDVAAASDAAGVRVLIALGKFFLWVLKLLGM